MDAFTILHHGAVDGVTGSCHELRVGADYGILIDCGLFQGAETSGQGAGAGQLQIEFPIAHIKALVVTHVHIDHVGRIPYLLAAGFKGPILCSQPSAQLLPLVLEDAVKVGFSRDPALVRSFLAQLREQLLGLPYGRWFVLRDHSGQRVRLRLQPAGHILGSAYVECEIRRGGPPCPPVFGPQITAETTPESSQSDHGRARESSQSDRGRARESSQSDHGRARESSQSDHGRARGPAPTGAFEGVVVFSGDLGAPETPLLPAPASPERCHTLVIESTYGDRRHPDRRQRQAQLQAVIEHAVSNSGVVLIPAFSIGRTQELLYELEGIVAAAPAGSLDWSRLAIIVDSPLAARFTAAYRQLKPFWDAEALAVLQRGRDPLDFDQLITIDSHAEHERLLRRLQGTHEPCVVIAASGMCAGGRIVNYLKALIGDARTDLLFVGYQARGTPGREILDAVAETTSARETSGSGRWSGAADEPAVTLDGQRYPVRAAVHQLGGYSAHADRQDLLDFVAGIPQPPAAIRIVHGDDAAKHSLAAELRRRYPAARVQIP